MKTRRLLSFFIAMLLVLSCAGWATAATVVEIGTAQQLETFRNRVNGGENTLDARLTADITLTANWTPIGTDEINDDGYAGTFDGNGKTIRGLVTRSAQAGSAYDPDIDDDPSGGLFGILSSDAVVRNLNIYSPDIDISSVSASRSTVGGIAAYNAGRIENCHVIGGGILIAKYCAGGIVGWNDGGEVTNSSANGLTRIKASDSAGGIVGYNEEGSVTNCTASGISNIEGSYAAGGVVGDNEDTVANCTVSGIGNITASRYAGGVAGHNYYAEITNNTVSAVERIAAASSYYVASAGGVVGYNSSGTVTNSTVSAVEYITAANSYDDAYAGGVVGHNERGTVANSTVSGFVLIRGDENTGGVVGYNDRGTVTNGTVSGGGSIESPYYSAGGVVGYNSGGTSVVTNCAASEIERITAEYDAGGVVGYNSSGTVTNCAATRIGSIEAEMEAGGVVGDNDYVVQNCLAQDISVNAGEYAGGVAGYSSSWTGTKIENCVAVDVAVKADYSGSYAAYAGGIVGRNSGPLINCAVVSSTAQSVHAASAGGVAYAGGVLGFYLTSSSSTVSNCVYPAGIVDTDGIYSAQFGEPKEWQIGNLSPDLMGNYNFTALTSYDNALAENARPAIVAVFKNHEVAVSIKKGETYTLDATTLPGTLGVGNLAFAWELSQPGVVSMPSASGASVTLTAEAVGTATVTCKVTGAIVADLTCAVTVTDETPGGDPDVDFTDITLNVASGGSVLLRPDGTFQVTFATVPVNAKQPQPIYDTSNGSVAIVSATGLVTAVGEGEATITVRVQTLGGQTIEKTFTVTVDEETPDEVDFTDITLNVPNGGTITLDPDGTFQITFTTDPANAQQPLPTYDTSDGSVAVVSASGRVTAIGEGSATITVTVTTLGGQTITKTFTVVVNEGSTETSSNGSSHNCGTFGFGLLALAALPFVRGKKKK